MNAWLACKDPAKIDALAARIAEHEPHRITDAGGNTEFAVWMVLVDRYIRKYTGLTHSDLPDWTWRATYDEDLSPADAAADALAHWHEYGDL